ncbi:helicase [Mesorhizobium sp. ORM16]|uniref:helicase n=1 Tax=Mesorhizobium sp. ORM16 TaxID=3376989 RepID=UPI003857B436
MTVAAYSDFLASKVRKVSDRGLASTPDLSEHLFPFQRSCVEHHLRVGSAGCFLDTGLGKTEVQLEFCQRAMEATNLTPIIWTPLAVAGQTKRRAEKWGYEARVVRDQTEVKPGLINICNYDRREQVDASSFGIVSCDEASILKSFSGVTRRDLTEAHRDARFKLVASATPAPNDHMEFGSYAEFCSVMAYNEMLSRFFINDTSTASQQWRLKGHAERPFWDWMASWARMAERPSDLGDDASDARYQLPGFEIVRHAAGGQAIKAGDGDMFGASSLSATGLHEVKRHTCEARAEVIAAAVASELDEPWVIWCDTNYEADALIAALPDAVEVRGTQSIEEKEEKLEGFASKQFKHLIAKPSMCFGLDWPFCARMAFAGRSYSYETWYQAVRRCLRFGQERMLMVHLAIAEGEMATGSVISRKSDDHSKMKTAMRAAMRRAQEQSWAVKTAYQPNHIARLAPWISAA